MIIYKTSINHNDSSNIPILSLASVKISSRNIIATISGPGEIKLWELRKNSNKISEVITIKGNNDTATTIRFSETGKFMATSSVSGRVTLYHLNTTIPNSKVTPIGYTKSFSFKHSTESNFVNFIKDEFLISSDIDGNCYVTSIKEGKITQKFKDHNLPIIGLETISTTISFNSNQQHLPLIFFTLSENKLCKYEYLEKKFELVKDIKLTNKSISVYETPRLSIFQSSCIALPLQSNTGVYSIDIYDIQTLKLLYSLIGHSLPTETIAFLPKLYKSTNKDKEIVKYSILASVSQDHSLSLWNSENCYPFVVVKNFINSNPTDIVWVDDILLVSTSIGDVRMVLFEDKELGDSININLKELEKYKITNIPFSIENIRIENNREKDVKINDNFLTLPKIKSKFTILNKGENNKEEGNKEEGNDLCKGENMNEGNDLCMGEGNIKRIKPIIKDEGNIKRIKPIIKNEGNSKPIIKNEGNIKPIIKNDNSKFFDSKIESNFVLFKDSIDNLTLPEIKSSLSFTEEFLINNNISYCISYNNNKITVSRNNIILFEIGVFNVCSICYSNQYLIISDSNYLKIYNILNGCLIYPFTYIKVAFMDIKKSFLLITSRKGEIKLLNLVEPTILVSTKLPNLDNLEGVYLDDDYVITAKYLTDCHNSIYSNKYECLHYIKSTDSWILLNPHIPGSIENNEDCTFLIDTTIEELENLIMVNRIKNNSEGVYNLTLKLVGICIRKDSFESYLEYKFICILKWLVKNNFTSEVNNILAQLNRIPSAQSFIERFIREFNIN